MQYRALCGLWVISVLLSVWIAPFDAYALPRTKSNDSIPLETGDNGDLVWDSIVPSQQLVFHQCYGDFECARLQVPLDYLAEDPDEAHAYIAIIKYASDPVDYPEYSQSWGGPIFLNPGGPGGSGVQFILESGHDLQKMAGSQYSIIGFDPRGVNNSRPAISCFDTPYDRVLFAVPGGGRILGSGGGEEVGELYVRGRLLGNICTTDEKVKDVQHLGAAYDARDMLAINEAIWGLAPKNVSRKGLQYWGLSYGSVPGIIYATLFPDKIERMILDGVVDVIDYFSGAMKKFMVDTEVVMDSFYEFCFKAGPVRCRFYTGSKPEHIQERLSNVLKALRTQPLPYSISPYGPSHTEIFTYSDLRIIITSALYTPLQSFEHLAEFLVLIESSFELGYLDSDPGDSPPLTCSLDESASSFHTDLLLSEAYYAIRCGESPPVTNLTLAGFRKEMEGFREQSPTLGDLFAEGTLPCIGWKAEAKIKPPRFEEAKDTDKWEGAQILFIGNTGDPVTPLENAYSMAKLFPANASATMVQEGEGHCSLSLPTECMLGAIQTYLATGKAPPKGNRFCSRVEAPFLGTLSGNPKRSEAVDTMRIVGQRLHRTTPLEPRALSFVRHLGASI